MTGGTSGFRVANVIFAILAVALATVTLWPIYQSDRFIILVAVTVLVSAAIGVLGAMAHLNSLVISCITACTYLLFGVPLAVPAAAADGVLPTWPGLLDLLSATAFGWKQLLTISLPVGDYQSLLVPAFILILLTGVVSVTIALRARATQLAALPPLVLWVAGILFGPEHDTWPRLAAMGLLIVILAWMAWISWFRRSQRQLSLARASSTEGQIRADARRSGIRRVVTAAAVIAVAVAAGSIGSSLLPAHASRAVLRSSIHQPFDPRDYPSPLSAFRSYLEAPTAQKAMLTVSGLPAGSRLRLATLDTYNGVVYSVGSGTVFSASGSFARLPGRVDASGVDGKQEHLEISIEGYSGVWVPTAGQLEQLDFQGSDASALADDFYYNDNTGTAAVISGLGRGDRYRLDAVVPAMRTPVDLAHSTPGSANLPPVSVVPAGLDKVLDEYTAGATTPGTKLEAALDGLQTNGYISHGISLTEPASRSGHGADRITQLLTDVPMIGDQEQYAATAALMARRLGYPARVVVGFVSDGASSGRHTFTGADISAWIQVQTAVNGWLTIDPNPPARPIPDKEQQSASEIARPRSIVPPPPKDASPTLDTPAQARLDKQKAPTVDSFAELVRAVLRIVGWSLLGLAILAAPFLTIIAAKIRRRMLRRRHGSSAHRVSGAWLEFADTARDYGYHPPPGSTRSEFALTVGGMRSLVLASVADRAVFSPTPPSAAEADRVWEALGALRESLGVGKSRWQRLRAAVSIQSFGRYRGMAASIRRPGRSAQQ